MTIVRMRVYGVPSPQAGTTSVPIRGKGGAPVVDGRGRPMFRKITEGGVNLKPWRQACADAAREQAIEHGRLDGALRLSVLFRMPMPKSRAKWMREQGIVAHTTTPDADKLLRAIGDSMKEGGLVADDARFALVMAGKVEVWESWTGALIQVSKIDVTDINAFRVWNDEAWAS